MIRSLSTFLSDLRKEPRYKLRLPCKMVLDGSEIGATVIEIGLGGARIELPPHGVALMPGALRAIRLPHTGSLKTQERWRRDGLIGVAFRGRETRLRVAAYFEELGLTEDDTSPGG